MGLPVGEQTSTSFRAALKLKKPEWTPAGDISCCYQAMHLSLPAASALASKYHLNLPPPFKNGWPAKPPVSIPKFPLPCWFNLSVKTTWKHLWEPQVNQNYPCRILLNHYHNFTLKLPEVSLATPSTWRSLILCFIDELQRYRFPFLLSSWKFTFLTKIRNPSRF